MVIESLMYANGLKKLLEAILFVAQEYPKIHRQICIERRCLEAAELALREIENPATEVLRQQLMLNRLREQDNDRFLQENQTMLKKANVKPTKKWFDKILADHNSRINEGNFQRLWAMA